MTSLACIYIKWLPACENKYKTYHNQKTISIRWSSTPWHLDLNNIQQYDPPARSIECPSCILAHNPIWSTYLLKQPSIKWSPVMFKYILEIWNHIFYIKWVSKTHFIEESDCHFIEPHVRGIPLLFSMPFHRKLRIVKIFFWAELGRTRNMNSEVVGSGFLPLQSTRFRSDSSPSTRTRPMSSSIQE